MGSNFCEENFILGRKEFWGAKVILGGEIWEQKFWGAKSGSKIFLGRKVWQA